MFGANASGKSNLLSGFRLMRDAVQDSFADWAKTPGVVPRQSFKLDDTSGEETSLFEADLVLGRDRVRYT
ncbi:AAA family ATPase [Rhizomonospora bruguierae]|uniref:AAA family ATPase n=1 Tax=Rhizomonospora bruguierae TaxID=1581705 RepID=UPI001BD09F79